MDSKSIEGITGDWNLITYDYNDLETTIETWMEGMILF